MATDADTESDDDGDLFSRYNGLLIVPDTLLIDLIDAMNVRQRFEAYGISPRMTRLVRQQQEIRADLTLLIGATTRHLANHHMNEGTIGDNESVQMLRHPDGALVSPFFEVTTENSILLPALSQVLVNRLTDMFNNIEYLCFVFVGERSAQYRYLTALLRRQSFSGNIHSLVLIDRQRETSSTRLFGAINQLPRLEILYLKLRGLLIHDLTILRQLNKLYVVTDGHNNAAILHNLSTFVPENDQGVAIDLANGENLIDELFILDERVRRQITRISNNYIEGEFPTIVMACIGFRSLRSLSIRVLPSNFHVTFGLIAELHQLNHLRLAISFENDPLVQGLEPFHLNLIGLFRDIEPNRAVQALEVDLTVTEHRQVDWLNLTEVLPNCQTLYLSQVTCHQCDMRTRRFAMPRDIQADVLLDQLMCLAFVITNTHRGVRFPMIRYHNQNILRGAFD